MRADSKLPILFLLAGLAATSAFSQDATAPAPESHDPRPLITAISLAEGADGVAVEVAFTKPVHAEVSRLEHPDRLVFDFPGCELAHPGQRLTVNRGSIITIRAAQFSAEPPIARIVVDLQAAQNHEEKYEENKLTIRFNASGGNIPAANSQPLALKSPREGDRLSDRAESISSVVAPKPATTPKPKSDTSTPTPSQNAQTATSPHAYTLLDKARTLTVSDLDPLEAKAQAGDPESETTLALAYHAGTLLKKNDAEALRLLQHAANRGFAAAEEAMGIFCQSGFGMPPDQAQAISWYTKAAQHGSSDAATDLALLYSTGDGVPKDVAKAATWFRNAAQAGDATAQLNLAALYHRGEGLPKDDAQAVYWLTKAADQGLLPAIIELAYWNLQPEHGVNVDAAIAWYKKAADQGEASAQAILGDIFVEQKFGRLDYTQAVNWYRKAADQGQATGQFGLGARYLLGQGVPQDLEEARRWLTPAANQGHPYAEFLLATMLQAGQGGPADAATAQKYYELAANYGIARAQYRLGLLLATDRNNTANLISAYKWLVLAQDTEKESAATALELRKQLTPEQVAQAEHEIDEWRTAHAPRQPSR